MNVTASDSANVPSTRALRRLVFMILWLIVLDRLVQPVLDRLETRRYEGTTPFRFENSDLFGLGPLVAYLREHPRGSRHRVVFLGNSMTFGYLFPTEQTMPAYFEKLRPDTRVFNMGINNQELGTSYLVTKAIIDSVDVLYVQTVGQDANPMLSSLIPIDSSDYGKFRIPRPDPVESRLQRVVASSWCLYRHNERLQAAAFGTSTRLFLYLHRDLLLDLIRRRAPEALAAAPKPSPEVRPLLRVPRAASVAPGAHHRSLLDDFADLARAHRKRIRFIEYEYAVPVDDTSIAQFNTLYAPYAQIAIIRVPEALTIDEQHFNAQGSVAVAELLAEQYAGERAQ